jgi:hypothetical protein
MSDEKAREILETRMTHLESLARVFMKDTGCKVEEIELVEQFDWDNKTVRWWYQRRQIV